MTAIAANVCHCFVRLLPVIEVNVTYRSPDIDQILAHQHPNYSLSSLTQLCIYHAHCMHSISILQTSDSQYFLSHWVQVA